MKIALAHKRLDLAGGTERDFYRTAEGLRDLGHEVHLFCGEFRVPAPEGTHAHAVSYWPLGRTARLLSFAFLGPRAIRSHRCDVVLSFGRMVQQDILRSGGGSHKLFLQKMEQGGGSALRLWHALSLYHRSVLAVEKRQFGPGGCGTILTVSGQVREEIRETYGVRKERIAVIYNGGDLERFHPRHRGEARQALRKRWGIPGGSPLVLFVGSGFRRKGLDRLLRAWESPRLAGCYLLVVGDDRQRQRYDSWAGRVAGGRVIFTGPQADVERYYGAADLLALPSLQEAFGNVVLEALASGLPVIVSRAVGAGEVLTGELRQGIVAHPDDPWEMESKISTMLDPARRPSLSQEARRLGEGYSWKNHFRELESYLLKAVSEGCRAEIA